MEIARMKRQAFSPYLEKPTRLADIVAAIQILGTDRYEKRRLEAWAKYLGDQPTSDRSWKHLFEKHPEFFGMEEERAFLVWRRAQARYDPDTEKEYSFDQIEQLKKQDPTVDDRLFRKPLTESQITTLINAAIAMQVQANAFEERRRWWVPAVLSSAATLLAVIVGALLKGA
jgi:hypothetical protein